MLKYEMNRNHKLTPNPYLLVPVGAQLVSIPDSRWPTPEGAGCKYGSRVPGTSW